MGTNEKAENIWPFCPGKPGQSTTCQSNENVFMWDQYAREIPSWVYKKAIVPAGPGSHSEHMQDSLYPEAQLVYLTRLQTPPKLIREI